MKNSNPLYVVKKDHIETADNVLDLLIKRFNLEPLIEFLMNLFEALLKTVSSYDGFQVVKELFDQVMQRLELFRKYSII